MINEYKDIQGYLSKKDKVLVNYINSLGGCLAFQDCKCLNKNSLIKVHYQPFSKFNSKIAYLSDEYFYEHYEDFICPNAVVIFELSKCFAQILNNSRFCDDKVFFRCCVKYFIEKNYKRYFCYDKENEMNKLYQICDKYYEDNYLSFNNIAQKTSYKNLNLSRKNRHTSIKVNSKNMKKLNETIINDLYEQYKSGKIRSVRAAKELYEEKTNEEINISLLYRRFLKISEERGEVLLKPKRIVREKKNLAKLEPEILNKVLKLRNAGFTYKECLEYLHETGIIISKTSLYNQLKQVENDEVKPNVQFKALLGEKEEKKQLMLM